MQVMVMVLYQVAIFWQIIDKFAWELPGFYVANKVATGRLCECVELMTRFDVGPDVHSLNAVGCGQTEDNDWANSMFIAVCNCA